MLYYSHSGNTAKIAKLIQRQTGADIAEIKPETAYPVDYDTVVAQAKKEIRAGVRPKIKETGINIDDYDTVLIGTPNWWSTMAPPVASFLERYDLSDKQAAVFCTHGGGGLSGVERDIRKLCHTEKPLKSLTVYGSGNSRTNDEITSWVNSL